MRTKYFLTAMCLPLAFAACTNEEFETIDNGLDSSEVVKMALSANYGTDGIESRMVNNNGTFLWDNTDVLGAAMPDTNADGVYSNNRFVNGLTQPSAAADFTTQSTTIAGEYTFYYPYSEDVTKNPGAGITYSLPAVQEYDPTGVKMMDNNFMVAPRITVDGKEPGTLTLPITMRSIYSYGLLNIRLADNVTANYSNVSNVNIQKIIIEYSSNVVTDGRIDLDALPAANITTGRLEAIQAGTYKADDTNVTYPSLKGKELAEIRAALLKEADDKLVGASTVYSAANADGTSRVLNLTTNRNDKSNSNIAKVIISCVNDQYPNGVALSKDGEFSTRVLLPTTSNAGVKTSTGATNETVASIKVYTDKGIATLDNSALAGGIMKANHTVNLANVNRNGEATALYINGALDTQNTTIEAISEADFIASMKKFAGQNNPNITVSVNGFNLTPTAMAAIPATANVTFTSGVTFEGDMNIKNMTFKDYAKFISGDVNLTQNTSCAALIVDGADVVISGNHTWNNDNNNCYTGIDVRNGSLEIAVYDNAGNPVTTEISGGIYVSVMKSGATPIVTITTPVESGTVIVAKDAKVVNNSTIENLTVNAGGYAENKGTLTQLLNQGTLDNSGIVISGVNEATLNQKSENAKVTLDKNSASGKIYTCAYSQTTVEKRAVNSTGEVINVGNLGEVIFVANARVSADGHVTYQAPADIKATDFSQLPTVITKIEFANDFTYNYVKNADLDESASAKLQDNVKTLVFHGNLTLGQDWALNSGSTIEFIGAKSDITGGKTLSNVTTINAGLAKIDGVRDAVPTKVYIGTNTIISSISTVSLAGGATVWNDGTVTGSFTKPTGWGGN